MVITTESICDQLRVVYKRLDTTKCEVLFQEIADGFALETKALTEGICTFRIEVTPFVFDVSALGTFNESDVEHDRFDFNQLVLSMAQGNVCIDGNKGKLSRPSLKVTMDCAEDFYMSYSRIMPMQFLATKEYHSYLISNTVAVENKID